MTKFWKWKPQPSEATRSRQRAERALEATKAETPEIIKLAQNLVRIQHKNHLGQSAARVLRGEK